MLSTVVNQELVKLQNWFAVNKLSVNVNKTSSIKFGKKNRNVPGIGITINQETIERVYKNIPSMISYHGKHKFNWLNPS